MHLDWYEGHGGGILAVESCKFGKFVPPGRALRARACITRRIALNCVRELQEPLPTVASDDDGAATRLLHAWSRGDLRARDDLMGLVYDELRRRAAAYLRRERRGHTLQPTAVRLALDLAHDMPPAIGSGLPLLSPDGTRIVYRGRSGQLLVRAIDAHDSTVVPGADNATGLFFSPDGQHVGFFADGRLKRIGLQGGRAVDLWDAPNPRGASWGEDGNIIAELDYRKPLVRIPAAGGTPQGRVREST